MTAFSAPLGCAFGTMAAWTAHCAGVGIVLAAIGGHLGWQREWIAAVVAPVAVATCIAATPALMAEQALHRMHEAVATEALARAPLLAARE
jgi:hypothetical protein